MSERTIHVAVIRTMRRQLAELIDRLDNEPRPGMSAATRAKTLRDMAAQHDALTEADDALTALYGEPPAVVQPDTEGKAN